jgi:hypothetical protein
VKVRVFHQCKPGTAADCKRFEAEDIIIDIEMPFLPAIGMDIKPTPDSDYLRVQYVFWDISTPEMVEAHIDQKGRLYPLKQMKAAGWRKA